MFGIYPGGAAGGVGPRGPLLPENPAKRLAALQRLKPAGAPFVVHLYAGYTGSGGYSASAQVATDIASYIGAGFQVELVLCYRPAGMNAAIDVPGFAGFVGDAVSQLARNRGLVSLQVTNEANIGGAPSASDGYYPGARDALIAGVVQAKKRAEREGFHQLRVGFNWAYRTGSSEESFWTYLGQNGGRALSRSTDWVGIDTYPGTWQPLPTGHRLGSAVRRATIENLRSLRETYMPLAAIAPATPIHVTEVGYPTGPGRTPDTQATALRAAIQAVHDYRATYNVSGCRWFDLRDANSASPSFEDQYGLMTDTYTPKPAFATYRDLIASL